MSDIYNFSNSYPVSHALKIGIIFFAIKIASEIAVTMASPEIMWTRDINVLIGFRDGCTF